LEPRVNSELSRGERALRVADDSLVRLDFGVMMAGDVVAPSPT
jgi:hypothetical protein